MKLTDEQKAKIEGVLWDVLFNDETKGLDALIRIFKIIEEEDTND